MIYGNVLEVNTKSYFRPVNTFVRFLHWFYYFMKLVLRPYYISCMNRKPLCQAEGPYHDCAFQRTSTILVVPLLPAALTRQK
jgi:hypothetical protein